MSRNPSPNAPFSSVFCCDATTILEMLCNGKSCGKNFHFSFYMRCDEIE